jgi:hypothetical protein
MQKNTCTVNMQHLFLMAGARSNHQADRGSDHQVLFGGGVLLFILGLGRVGPVRGLRGGGRGGWCEERARSG